MHVSVMRDFLVSDQRTDEQADSRSWMMLISITLDLDTYVYDAYIYDQLILLCVCMMHIYLILDPDVCRYDACV